MPEDFEASEEKLPARTEMIDQESKPWWRKHKGEFRWLEYN